MPVAGYIWVDFFLFAAGHFNYVDSFFIKHFVDPTHDRIQQAVLRDTDAKFLLFHF